MVVPLEETSQPLKDDLHRLGHEYGPLGVAQAAALLAGQDPELATLDGPTLDEHGLVPAPPPLEVPPNVHEAGDGTLRYLTVHECLGRILAELEPIGRDSEAPKAIGGFKFRGIEAVKDALNPLLGKYGVFYLPRALERVVLPDRGKEHVVAIHVEFTFYGPAGDSVAGSVWGEGMDTRDKGIQKANTSAEKYMLVEAFAIATNEQSADDLDRNESPEPPFDDHRQQQQAAPEPEPERALPSELEALVQRLLRVMDGEEYPEAWKTSAPAARGPGRIETITEMLDGERAPMTKAHLEGANALLQQIEDAARESLPCELCGSARTNRLEVEGVWRCADPKGCAQRIEKAAGEPGPSDGSSGDAESGDSGAASPAPATEEHAETA